MTLYFVRTTLFAGGFLFALSSFGCSTSKKTTDEDAATDTLSSDTSEDPGEDTADSDEEKITFDMQNQTVFSQDQILEYHITIDPDDLDELNAHGNEEVYYPVSLQVVGDGIDETFEKVGFRYKGAWTLHHCWDDNGGVRSYEGDCARLSTKIKFDKYDKDARFYGLKRLNLHSMINDESKMRERLSYSLFNEFDVVAPRTAHAKVYVNGEMAGLYIAVENIDGRFAHFHYPKGGDGNLYKEVWPSANVDEGWVLSQLKTNEEPEDNPDVSDFMAFTDAIAKTDVDSFESTMAKWIDLDNLVRYLVVDRAIRNWDGIMAFYSSETSHNFFWYHDDGPQDIFHLIPWDLDNAIKDFDFYMDPQKWCVAQPIPDWNEEPAECSERHVCTGPDVLLTPPRCDHFIDMLALTQWPLFEKRGAEFLSKLFTYDNMNAKIEAWAKQIADAVVEDPLVDAADWENQVTWFGAVLKDAVNDFQAHLDEGLIEEQLVTPPDETLFTVATEAGGLRADTINNFEVDAGTESAYDDFLNGSASKDSTFAFEWNTASPISGAADLQFTMNFMPVDEAWSEWGGYIYTSEAPLDITPYSRLWISLSANKEARFRVELRSSTYADYGDIYEVFSNEFYITTEPKLYYFKLTDFEYPQWAKDAWVDGDGWTDKDSEILLLVLANISGLGFQMFPTWDSAGAMSEEEEEIVVHVDNIYFE